MKRIHNIHIRDSLNIGQEDVLYENIKEIEKAFPDINYDLLDIAKEKLNYHNAKGLVKHKCFRNDRPYFVHVVDDLKDGEPIDKYEVLGGIRQLIDVPVTHEKVLRRK